MSHVRVYQRADDSVVIVVPASQSRSSGESEAAWYARMMARTEARSPDLQGRPSADVESTELPDPATRHAWRLKNGKVVVDPTVPDPRPVPNQALKAELAAATTVAQLKAALLAHL